jgi:site-specific DNA-adenine methylase
VAFVYEASWKDTLSAVAESKILDGTRVFTYLDPPFFYKADKLYRFYFRDDEHIALRDSIANLSGDWLLSYDSVPRVAELYMNHTTLDLGAIYTASTAGGYKAVNEAVVSNLHLPRSNDSTSIHTLQQLAGDIKNA